MMHHRILVFQIPVTILPVAKSPIMALAVADDRRSIETCLAPNSKLWFIFKETVVSISFDILGLIILVFRITF